MSCGNLTPANQRSLTALTATGSPAFEPFTEWMPCTGLDDFRAVVKVKGVTGNFQAKPAYQLAGVRTDAPEDWVAAGSWSSGTEDEDTYTVTVTTTTKFWIRFGIAYASSSSGTADCSIQVSFDVCGDVVGRWAGQLHAWSTTNVFQPVTGWIPALHAAKVKMALIATGADATFQYTPAFQTATYVPESPAAWNATWSVGPGNYTDDGENDTGEMVAAFGTVGWVRFGIAYKLTSGTIGQGFLSIATAIRNS